MSCARFLPAIPFIYWIGQTISGECEMTIQESLLDAFRRNWDIYKDLVKQTPEEHWRTGDVDYLIPARLVYHALEAADFYSSPTPKGFVAGHRFGVDWEAATPEQLPTREQTSEYLKETMKKVDGWLRGMSDSDLLSPQEEFRWTGKTVLGRAIYLLVHCRQHIGEINAELRRRGLPRAKWR